MSRGMPIATVPEPAVTTRPSRELPITRTPYAGYGEATRCHDERPLHKVRLSRQRSIWTTFYEEYHDMSILNNNNGLFVLTAFSIQIVLVMFFAARKWEFDMAMRYGWIVYALGVPAVIVSLVLLIGGKPWYQWLPGFLYAAWAVFGYVVDIAHPVAWRNPIFWPVFIPYLLLYLSSQMFYWWPLALIQRPLWFIYAMLFAISTTLNISSH